MKTALIYMVACFIIFGFGVVVRDTGNRVEELSPRIIPKDSTDKMIKFINYVDTAHVVEDITDSYHKLEDENKKCKQEILKVKRELEKVKMELKRSKEVVKPYIPDTIFIGL